MYILFISILLLCIMLRMITHIRVFFPGFQLILSLKVNNVVMLAKSFIVLVAFLSQLTLYSFVGDYLKSEMEKVGLSIYQSPWCDFPTKLTRSMIFVLMQTIV